MAASPADKVKRTGNGGIPVIATVQSARNPGDTTLHVDTQQYWPTASGVSFSIFSLDSSGNRISSTQTDWDGVTDGINTITGMVQTGGAVDIGNNTSQKVAMGPTADWADNLAQAFLKEHTNPLGAHGNVTATSVTTPTATITNLTVSNLTLTGTTPAAGFTPLGQTLAYSTNNGHKEIVLTASADLTGTLSAGMKLAVTRSTTPGTQSMAFVAANSQYATKTSPTNMASTTAFTVECLISPDSYQASNMMIGSRYDGTNNGFALFLTANQGQLAMFVNNAGTTKQVTSYNIIPLKRWTHVACAYNAGTMTLYVNGEAIGAAQSGSGTAIGVGGPFQLGAYNSVSFFDGKISEFRYWPSVRSATQIADNMSVNLTGNEGMSALIPGNGNFNDISTGTANTLIASGGAIATFASNPFNTIEKASILNVTYSSPTSTITVTSGDSCFIPNMVLNAASYSVSQNPYGLPADLVKPVLSYSQIGNTGQNSTGSPDWLGSVQKFTQPSNATRAKYTFTIYAGVVTANGAINFLLYDTFNSVTTLLRNFPMSSGNTSQVMSWTYSVVVPMLPGVHSTKIVLVPTGSQLNTYSSAATSYIPEVLVESV